MSKSEELNDAYFNWVLLLNFVLNESTSLLYGSDTLVPSLLTSRFNPVDGHIISARNYKLLKLHVKEIVDSLIYLLLTVTRYKMIRDSMTNHGSK